MLRAITDSRAIALVVGVLAALGLMGATLSFTVDLLIASWRIYGPDLEESIHLLASILCLAGAFQLSRGGRRGRRTILAGLLLNIGATIEFSTPTLSQLDTIGPMVTWVVLGVLTVLSRRPEAAPAPEAAPGWQQPAPEPPPPPGWQQAGDWRATAPQWQGEPQWQAPPGPPPQWEPTPQWQPAPEPQPAAVWKVAPDGQVTPALDVPILEGELVEDEAPPEPPPRPARRPSSWQGPWQPRT